MFNHQYTKLPEPGLEQPGNDISFPKKNCFPTIWRRVSIIFGTIGCHTTINYLVTIVNSIIVFYIFAFYAPSDSFCAKQLSAFSPAIQSVEEYRDITFTGTLTAPSKYRGVPSPEIDKSWNNITNGRFIPITPEELAKLGKSDISVKYPLDRGGKYVGMLEVFHQLHCLNMLRMASYPEYYNTTGVHEGHGPDMDHTHIDHCIEMLRQNLMCTSDVGIVTLNWVKGQEHPTPDFNTKHKCRNFDDVWQWNQEHSVRYGSQWRYGGEVELDHIP